MSWAIKLMRAEGIVDPPRCSGVLLPTGHVLDNEADSVLQTLQFQSVRRLCGAPLLRGSNISGER